MTSIDERIKRELEREGSELESRFPDESIPSLVSASFKGAMRSWMWFVGGCTTVLGAVTVWTGVEFVSATGLEDKLVWGVWLLLAIILTSFFEMWCWMQVNRLATKREIERLDIVIRHNAGGEEIEALRLAIADLSTKLKG